MYEISKLCIPVDLISNTFWKWLYSFQIIHLKRFQLLNGRWVKSQKIVKFPFQDVDLGDYLVSRLQSNQSESTKLENASESTNHNTEALQSPGSHSSGAIKATNQKPNGTAVPVKGGYTNCSKEYCMKNHMNTEFQMKA